MARIEDFTQEEIEKMFNRDEAELLKMDDTEFRARFRERCHHTLEIQTYAAAYRNKKLNENQTKTALKMMAVWREKNLPTNLPDYQYAVKLVGIADKLIDGQKVDLGEFAPSMLSGSDVEAFDRIMYERRSVREWTGERVSDEVIDKLLNAGLWAAHSCNLQSVRYLVIREESTPGLFKGSDIRGGPVHIVLLQDERVYRANPFNPVRNRLLDCGAAAQNIVLAAHAYGLGGVWLTFNDTMKERLQKHFNLPEYISVVTYVDVGHPDQTPYPPQRITIDEAQLFRV